MFEGDFRCTLSLWLKKYGPISTDERCQGLNKVWGHRVLCNHASARLVYLLLVDSNANHLVQAARYSMPWMKYSCMDELDSVKQPSDRNL
jgi:hypothetical protein